MGMIFSMMKCKWHMATMSLKQKRLYNIMGRTLETDTSGHTVSFKVPYDADPKDVAAVKKQLELENFYAVKLVNTPPPPSGIDMPQAMGALKGILASTVSELQSVGDTTRKDIRADLEAIYLPKRAPALKA